ncbi:Grm8, partial [Symbiodinium sp. KB8]
ARTNIQRLAKAFRTILMIVALPFTPVDSFGLQKKQVSEIALRFRRYKERAAAAAMDEADDDIVRAEFGEKVASEVGSEEAFLDQ